MKKVLVIIDSKKKEETFELLENLSKKFLDRIVNVRQTTFIEQTCTLNGENKWKIAKESFKILRKCSENLWVNSNKKIGKRV